MATVPSQEKNSTTNITHHQQLPLNIPRPRQTIIVLPLRQRLAMNISSKVTHRRLNPTIQRTPVRKVTTQTHTRRANTAIARRQREQIVYRETGVFVVGG
jgi:hypothetical protein